MTHSHPLTTISKKEAFLQILKKGFVNITWTVMLSASSNFQSHTSVLPAVKGLTCSPRFSGMWVKNSLILILSRRITHYCVVDNFNMLILSLYIHSTEETVLQHLLVNLKRKILKKCYLELACHEHHHNLCPKIIDSTYTQNAFSKKWM